MSKISTQALLLLFKRVEDKPFEGSRKLNSGYHVSIPLVDEN